MYLRFSSLSNVLCQETFVLKALCRGSVIFCQAFCSWFIMSGVCCNHESYIPTYVCMWKSNTCKNTFKKSLYQYFRLETHIFCSQMHLNANIHVTARIKLSYCLSSRHHSMYYMLYWELLFRSARALVVHAKDQVFEFRSQQILESLKQSMTIPWPKAFW